VVRRVHLWIGGVGVLAFVLTGQYMDRWHAHLSGMPDLPRMLYRSGHIYLLFASLLNLLLGVHLDTRRANWLRVEWLASFLIATAPALLVFGFALEPSRTDFERPYARLAIYGCFAGVLLHALSRLVGGKPAPENRTDRSVARTDQP
jgi:hypothetical protein